MSEELEEQQTPTPFVEPSTEISASNTTGVPAPRKRSAEELEDIVEEAAERFRTASDDDRDNIRAQKEDIKFVYQSGAQWSDEVRERWGKDPVLEFPQLKQFVHQVVNDQRQNRPGVRIHPAGAQASNDIAELYQGLVRGIENHSQGEAVYDTGYQFAVVGGRGYWRVLSEYEKPDSFNQVLKLRAINDPSTVRMDLEFQEPDASDCNYYFITERLQRSTFEQRWPDCDAVTWAPDGDAAYWYDGKDIIVIADYYRRVSQKRVLVMLVNGQVGFLDELEAQMGKIPKLAIKVQRETDDYRVEWFKIAGGQQVLAEYTWPGRTIPVICDMGDNIMVDGKRVFQGLVRQARDAQRMYNYEKSLKALLISMYPLAPFVASDEAIEGRETMWDNANKARYSTLIYNAKDENGQPIPRPERMQFGAVPAALSEAMQSDKEDIKAIIGMYQNNLGMNSQEVSGRAILAREKQGNNATFHFADNHSRAIALTGRIIVECAPTFYDTERLVPIIKADDTHEMVTLNQQSVQQDAQGMIQAFKLNDIAQGEYAVTVEAGPSYATQREQTRDYMIQLVQANPAVMQIGGDIIVKSMDFPDADELAERLQLVMPPPIQQHLQSKTQGMKVPPQVAQQMMELQGQLQQMQQGIQQLQQENQQLKAGVTQKIEASKLDADVTLQKAGLDAETELKKATIIAETSKEKALIDAQTKLFIEQMNNEAAATVPVAAPLENSMQPMMALTEQIAEMARVLAMPRRSVLELDANGEVMGAVSMPHDGAPSAGMAP